MKTIFGTVVPRRIRAILYLCQFKNKKLTITSEILCSNVGSALCLYAEIPNPASQLITGKTYKELEENLEKFHKNITDPVWLEKLSQEL